MKYQLLSVLLFLYSIPTAFGDTKGLGVVHHLGNPHVTKDVSQITRDLNNIDTLGVDFVREGIYWNNLQSKVYLDKTKQMVKMYNDHNITILALLAYSNASYAKNKFSFVELAPVLSQVPIENVMAYLVYQFSKYFEFVIKTFPSIKYYELLNEMNIPKYFEGGNDPISLYVSILRVCNPIAKKYNVKLLTGGILLEGNYMQWIDRLLENADLYDIFALHPYCYPKKLSDAKFGSMNLKQLVDKIHKNSMIPRKTPIHIWITEVGWLHSNVESVNPTSIIINEDKFNLVLRDLRQVEKSLGIKKTFMYSLEDDSHSGSENYKPFGFQLKSGKLKQKKIP